MTLVLTIDRVPREVWPNGEIVRMHVRCDGCGAYAPGGTYAQGRHDDFTRERVCGEARDAGWASSSGGRWTCVGCLAARDRKP